MSSCTLQKWSFKNANDSEWHESKSHDGTFDIIQDLLEAGTIEDPFVNDQEKNVQWVGENDWEYQCEFQYQVLAPEGIHSVLVFEGLDTYADVYLNEELVLSSSNQFHIHRLKVQDKLRTDNRLRIYFHSLFLRGKQLEKKHGQYVCSNGDYSRVHVRKAQYHYGWDWGPKLMTCGAYRPIRLVCYGAGYVDEVGVDVRLDEDLARCELEVWANLEGAIFQESEDDEFVTITKQTVKFSLFDYTGRLVDSVVKAAVAQGECTAKFVIRDPDLWFPRGYGDQRLYKMKVELFSDSCKLHQVYQTVGVRTALVVEEAIGDEPGKSFYFQVNGVSIFSGGSNWIPLDSLITRASKEKYTRYLNYVLESNQVMVRVWGGGYYETDHFYETCDRLGILVFQDLMFACGQYPCYSDFEASVKQELQCQLQRLSKYACIVCVAGNNEDYVLAAELGYDFKDKNDHNDYRNTSFPARTFYEGIFPKLVRQYLGSVHYQPSSPYGGDDANSVATGDIHQWNIWHGKQARYQDWQQFQGRFVSEFGMESLPSYDTLSQYVGSEELAPQSRLVEYHNKAAGASRRLASYCLENFSIGAGLKHWIYLTQLMQSECYSYAYKLLRREWKTTGRRVGGALVWQLNDCWPGASWSIIDYHERKKLGFYAIKRELSTVVVAMFRNEYLKDTRQVPSELIDTTHDFRLRDYVVDIWASNFSLSRILGIVKCLLFNVNTGSVITQVSQAAIVPANGSLSLLHLKLGNSPETVLQSILYGLDGKIISRSYDWPQPLKHVQFSKDIFLQYQVYNDCLLITTNRPVKGVQITTRDEVILEDNGFDLCPGDARLIGAKNITYKDKVYIRHYSETKYKPT